MHDVSFQEALVAAQHLIAAVFHHHDSRNFEAEAECFIPDGVWNRKNEPLKGRQAIVETLKGRSASLMTMHELSDKVGLSVSPCHRRVKLLEERGVITRYIPTVDQKSLGLHVSVFISIKLARQKEEDLNRFAKAISKWDEVLECYLMTGNRDYLLRVVAADLSSYEAFLKNKLTRLDGIASIESSFALSQVKYSIALPV